MTASVIGKPNVDIMYCCDSHGLQLFRTLTRLLNTSWSYLLSTNQIVGHHESDGVQHVSQVSIPSV
jgi:hypothetical protein